MRQRGVSRSILSCIQKGPRPSRAPWLAPETAPFGNLQDGTPRSGSARDSPTRRGRRLRATEAGMAPQGNCMDRTQPPERRVEQAG